MSTTSLMAVLAANSDYDSGTADFGSKMNPLVTSFDSFGSSFEYWAATIVTILGVVGLLIGTYMLVKNLISKGRTGREQTSWMAVILVIVVGACFLFGGWALSVQFGNVLEGTIRGWF